MKKILLLFLIILTLPVHAANWKQIGEKEYVDLNSIEKYNDKYQMRNNEIYSFWIKLLNDKSNYFINFEKKYNKKIWYNLNRQLVDCKNKTIAVKASAIYGLDEQIVNTYEVSDYSIKWNSIVPDSIGESYYYGVCTP